MILAAWVQAIGTFIALGIAIAVPWFQHRQDQKARAREHEKYYEAINSVASLAIHEARKIERIINGPHSEVEHEGVSSFELAQLKEILNTITLETLPDKGAYIALYKFTRETGIIISVANDVDQNTTSEGVHPESSEAAEKSIARAEKAYSVLDAALIRFK